MDAEVLERVVPVPRDVLVELAVLPMRRSGPEHEALLV
jgi:hypothetical protein